MLGIITGTIKPSAQMGQLAVRDEEERLKQYTEGLKSLLNVRAFSKLVFCENSNYGVEKLYFLTEIAKDKGIDLELLSFQGDTKNVCIHGKGYGEGEIMEYVFSNSRLISGETYFVKVTGRLKVDNGRELVSRLLESRTYFNIPNRTIKNFYDTRIYGMPIQQFKDFFLHAYHQVMDEQGIFLEIVYTKILQDNGIKVYNFPRYPRIKGISGSGGIRYDYTEWKCRIRDVLSRMNVYTIKRTM
ncbi:MAG: hypothetical protein K2N15_14220 [Lachnospiraceae bacterium]|nr:hypothetical protein [Lachnospiraceae bacterium]